VDVIGHASGLERRRLQTAKDSREVGMQAGADFRLNEWLTVLRAEDHMDQDFGERLGHSSCCVALSGLLMLWNPISQAGGLG
jgi:hypothetical protein